MVDHGTLPVFFTYNKMCVDGQYSYLNCFDKNVVPGVDNFLMEKPASESNLANWHKRYQPPIVLYTLDDKVKTRDWLTPKTADSWGN